MLSYAEKLACACCRSADAMKNRYKILEAQGFMGRSGEQAGDLKVHRSVAAKTSGSAAAPRTRRKQRRQTATDPILSEGALSTRQKNVISLINIAPTCVGAVYDCRILAHGATRPCQLLYAGLWQAARTRAGRTCRGL